MDISNIREFADLIPFWQEKDTNHDGRIDVDNTDGTCELAGAEQLDKDGGGLSPWEVMDAVTRAHPEAATPIFSATDIATIQRINNEGKTFPDLRVRGSATFQGITFPDGTLLKFQPNGQLASATLSQNTTFGGVTFKAGTELTFDASGNITGTLAGSGMIEIEVGGNKYKFKAGTEIQLFRSGRIRSAILARDKEVNGLTFKEGTALVFDDSSRGRIREGTLAAAKSICGTTLPAGTVVRLGLSGEPCGAVLAAPLAVRGVLLPAGSEIQFSDGVVRSVRLAENVMAGGLVYKKDTTLWFYANGQIEMGTLAADYRPSADYPSGTKFKAGTDISFHPNGRIHSGTLTDDANVYVGEIKLKGGTAISFHHEGGVLSGTLADDAQVSVKQGKLMGGTEVDFTVDGRIYWGTSNGISTADNDYICPGEQVQFDENGDPTRCPNHYPSPQGVGLASPEAPTPEPFDPNVRELAEIVNYYEKDTDRDGRLEEGEIGAFAVQYDQNGDGGLSPWEVMEAVNRSSPVPVYSPETIRYFASLNTNGLNFPKLRITDEDTVIQGVPCKVGTEVVFNLNGQIQSATLSENYPFKGATFKAGTQIFITPAGVRIGILAEPLTITLDSQEVTFRAGCSISIDQNGRVLAGTLAENAEISGKSLVAGSEVYLNTSGRLTGVKLAVDTTFEGTTFPAGTRVNFNAEGRVVSAILSQLAAYEGRVYPAGIELRICADGIETWIPSSGAEINGIKYKAGTQIFLRATGDVYTGILADDTVIEGLGVKLRAGSRATFYPNGQLESGELAEDFTLGEIKFKAGTRIDFHANGTVACGTVAQGKAHGLDLKPGSPISFHSNGQVAMAVFGTDLTVEGSNVKLKAGSGVHFDAAGKVIEGVLVADTDVPGVQGAKLKGGSTITFHSNGKVASGTLAAGFGRDNWSIAAGRDIHFDTTGTPLFEQPQAEPEEEDCEPNESADPAPAPPSERVTARSTPTQFHFVNVSPNFTPPPIVTIEELVNFFGDRDMNESGRLEAEEVPEMDPLDFMAIDQDNSGDIAPWELMEAINRANPTPIFSPQAVAYFTKANLEGKTFPNLRTKGTTVIHGNTFPDGTILSFNDFGNLESAVLPSRGNCGIWQKGSTVDFYGREGFSGTLAANTPINVPGIEGKKIKFKGGTELRMELSGTSGTLAENTIIAGVKYEAGTFIVINSEGEVTVGTLAERGEVGGVTLDAGTEFTYDPEDRNLEAKIPAGTDLVINNVSYKAGTNIYFVEGRVSEGVLNSDYRDPNGNLFGPGTLIVLNQGGKVISAKINAAGTTLLGNNSYPVGSEVEFDEEGHVTRALLGADATIRDNIRTYHFKANSVVEFYPDGRVKSGRLAEDLEIELEPGKKIKFKAGTPISFYPDGSVETGTLADGDAPLMVQGRPFKPGTEIGFHSNGKIGYGIAGAAYTIQEEGVAVENGGLVQFDETGHYYTFSITTST